MAEENKNEVIIQNDQQDKPIILDLDKNTLKINQQFVDILAQAKDINERGEKLAKVDVNDIDEDEMKELNKQIKPISAYEKKFKDFRKYIKKQLQERDQVILDSLDKTLDDAGFDKLPETTKKLRQLKKDFQANRANQRWAQLQTVFQAQLETYPELAKYAPKTLGNFDYYRLHHSDLVSSAKTKPVTNDTIKELNQDLYNYHDDLQHLLDSSLAQGYYKNIIEQYAAEPSTNKILSLIDSALAQQAQDQNKNILDKAELTAKNMMSDLWFNNQTIQNRFDKLRPEKQPETEFVSQKLKLMKGESTGMINSLNLENMIENGKVDEISLKSTLKDLIKAAFVRVTEKLQQDAKDFDQATQAQKLADQKKQEQQKQKEAEKAKVKAPYQWLLDYLQSTSQTDIVGNNKIKVRVITQLITQIREPDSVWRENLKSNEDIIETIKYITEM